MCSCASVVLCHLTNVKFETIFPLLFLLTHNQLSFSIYFAGTEQEQQDAVTGRQADRHHSLQYNKYSSEQQLLKADEAANAGTYTHAVTDLHSDGVRDDNGVGVSGSVLKV